VPIKVIITMRTELLLPKGEKYERLFVPREEENPARKIRSRKL
jgi:hypothetical protein